MPGKITQLKPLETRKQLLLIESELNRVQLLKEIGDFKGEISHLKHQVTEISSIAASAAELASTFNSVRRVFSHSRDDGEKGPGSWISTLIEGAKAGASVWHLFRRKE